MPRTKNGYCQAHRTGELLVLNCHYVDAAGNNNTCTNTFGVSKKSDYYCYGHVGNKVNSCKYKPCDRLPRTKNGYCRKHGTRK